MKENPKCSRCDLCWNARDGSVCLKGEGGMQPKLMIYLDSPSMVEDRRGKPMVGEPAMFLKDCLARMSLKPSDYYIDYVLKCYSKCKAFGTKSERIQFLEACSIYRFANLQRFKPRAVIGMGRICVETFVGSGKISDYAGTSWTPTEPRVRDCVDHIWITYSPAYALESPAESVGIFRTLFAAAEDAGLKPTFKQNMKPYDYGT